VDFTIEDERIDPSQFVPSSVVRAIEIIDGLPDGKLLTGETLSRRVGITSQSWNNYCNHPLIESRKALVYHGKTNKNLYGNEATIAAFKEQAAV
jgi:hypothetical protein